MRWLLFSLLAVSACRTSPVEYKPCPCAYEWTCCANENICVREGAACPAVAPGSDLSLAGDLGAPADAASADAAPDASPSPPVVTCATGRWCWLTPEPTGDNYAGLWGVSANDLWMATESGTIAHFDGAALELKYQVPYESFTGAVGGRSANDVWFLFNDSFTSHAVRWDGAKFADLPVLLPGHPPLYALSMTAQSVWLAGESGTLLQAPYYASSAQYGYARAPAAPLGETGALVDVWAADDDHVWALGAYATIYSGGATATAWTKYDPREGLPNPNVNEYGVGLWGSGPNDVWEFQEESGSGYSGMVFRHFDGTTWTRTQADYCDVGNLYDSGYHRHVWANGANDIWVSGNKTSCDYHWNGATWTNAHKSSNYDLLFSDGANLFSASDSGQLHQQIAGSWSSLVAPIGSGALSLSALGENDVFAVDATGDLRAPSVVHYDGTGWSKLASLNTIDYPPYEYPLSIFAVADDDVWVSGSESQYLGPVLGFIQHWNGTAWDAPLVTDQPALAMWGGSATNIWAGGSGWLKRWNGTAWSDVANAACTLAITGVDDQVFIHAQAKSGVSGCTGDELMQHWDGATLTTMPAPGLAINYNRESMRAFSATDLWWVGGNVAHWDGSAWTSFPTPPDTAISAVFGERPDEVWFGGNHLTRAALLRWDGVSLTADTSPHVGSPLYALTGAGGALFTGGAGGGVLRGVPTR